MSNYVTMVPSASLLMESLRSVGYGVEMAIADIIDNSISANAVCIRVIMEWQGQDSQIIITDDGNGMNHDCLISSMKFGSADPKTERNKNDLGRFGMGMKTASLSMGKRLTVISKCNNELTKVCWDLDFILEQHNAEWPLIVDPVINQDESLLLDQYEHGTAVIISSLDRITISRSGYSEKSKEDFFQLFGRVEKHLSLVFHRFISDRKISFFLSANRNETGINLEAWDPFILKNRATQELSEESYNEDGVSILIQPYVLPHKTKFASTNDYDAAGGRGWDKQQGFYLYRNRRLIVYGTWFKILKKEPAFNLARISIDIDSSNDFDWKIDIKKASATPPLYVRDLLEKIAYVCTERSALVYNSRGKYVKSSTSQSLDYVWEQRRNRKGNYNFYINKKHPLFCLLKNTLDELTFQILESYIALVENFAPFMQSGIVDNLIEASQSELEDNNSETVSLLSEIREYICSFKSIGYSDDEIKTTILNMPNYRQLKKHISELFEEKKI